MPIAINRTKNLRAATLIAALGLAVMVCATLPSPAAAASFDCEKPDLAADEKAICDNRGLNDADVKMVTTFDLLSGLFAMGNRGVMQDEQITWLKKRQACDADVACLKAAYDERLKQLQDGYNSLTRPQ